MRPGMLDKTAEYRPWHRAVLVCARFPCPPLLCTLSRCSLDFEVLILEGSELLKVDFHYVGHGAKAEEAVDGLQHC